jgi:hypothetical protein
MQWCVDLHRRRRRRPRGPAGGIGDIAVGRQEARAPHRHRVVYATTCGLSGSARRADRLPRASQIALRVPNPGRDAKAGRQGLLPPPASAASGLLPQIAEQYGASRSHRRLASYEMPI